MLECIAVCYLCNRRSKNSYWWRWRWWWWWLVNFFWFKRQFVRLYVHM